MKKLASLVFVFALVITTSIGSFAATPSTTFKKATDVIGFQSFQESAESVTFQKLEEKKVYSYYREPETIKFIKDTEATESALTLSKDKKSIKWILQEGGGEGQGLITYIFTKDSKGKLLIAASYDEELSKAIYVTTYPNEAEMLKAAVKNKTVLALYKAELDEKKAADALVAAEKATFTKPVTETNKLMGYYISSDKKLQVEFWDSSLFVTSDGNNVSYDIQGLTHVVGTDGLVTSTYTTPSGKFVFISQTKGKIVKVAIPNIVYTGPLTSTDNPI